MLSKRVQSLRPSPTLVLDAKAKALQASGTKVINLAAGEPDFPTPAYIQEAGTEAISGGFTRYTPSAGILELRQAVAKKLSEKNSGDYDPSEIVVGVGAKQVLHLAFQTLCDEGDEVILPTPVWSTYIEQVKLAGGNPVLVKPLTAFQVTAKTIAEHVTTKTKIIVLNTPCNPTGAVIKREEMEQIAELAIKNNIFIISDEIYEEFIYEGKHCSIASLAEDVKRSTITVNGFSKSYAMTGWRVGYGAGPQDIISAMAALASQTTSCTSTVSQAAALEALTSKESEPSIRNMREEFRKRRDIIFEQLSAIEGIEVHKPQGAFYIFPDISKLLGDKYPSSSAWAEELLEKEHVAVVPGEVFEASGHIRLSFAVSPSDLREGIERIKRFIS